MTEEEKEAFRRALAEEMSHGAEKPAPDLPMPAPDETAAYEAALAEEVKRNEDNALPALGYGFTKGLTMGADDELAAYFTDADVAETRANRKDARDAAPAAGFVGEIAGSLLPGFGAMGAGLKLPSIARGGLGRQVLAGTGIGAGMAATQGFLEGEGGFVNRLKSAVDPWRIGTGAAVGAAVPLASRLAGGVAGRGLRSPVGALKKGGMSGKAASELARRFDDDSAVRGIRQYLDDLGPEGMLADAGPSMRGLASKGVTTMDGPQRPLIYGAVTSRGEGAAGRLTNAIDDAIGHKVNMAAAREAMDAARNRWADPAYKAFGDKMFPMTPDLRETLNRAAKVGALKEARTIARAEGFDLDPKMFTDPKNVEISGRALDYISRGLRDTAAAKARTGATGAGHSMRGLNDALLDNVPELRGIRRRFADDMAMREATEGGAAIFKRNMSPDDFNAMWKEMSPGEKAAFRASARDAIEQMMGNARNEANAVIGALDQRNVAAKLETVFGADAVNDLRRAVDAETVFRNTRNTIVRDAELSPRYPGQRNPYGEPVDADGLPQGPYAEIKRLIGQAWQGGKRSVSTRQDAVSTDLARALTARGPERDRLVNALLKDQLLRQNRGARAANIEELTRLLLSGPGGAAILNAEKMRPGSTPR